MKLSRVKNLSEVLRNYRGPLVGQTFPPRGFPETVTSQNIFPLGGICETILTLIPLFGNLKKENRNKDDEGEGRGKKNKKEFN